MSSLTHEEAVARAELISVTAMTVDLDLSTGPETFESVTTIDFDCAEAGGATFVDIKPITLHALALNGSPLPVDALEDGRYRLTGLAAHNTLTVRATMGYSHDGQGLHRATDPADGEDYIYGHLFLDAAPKVFACFDQPDLKAPYAIAVTAPTHWRVIGNGAATQVRPGRWELAMTRPLATYFVTVCAGPYVSVEAVHDGIPLGLHARSSLADHLREQAPALLEITKQSFDYQQKLFGIRYPFGEYHQVFVPEFNAGAMENPGCIVVRDQYIFRGAVTRDQRLQVANTLVHEMAHQWFGDLVTLAWWDDLWLNESFAEYIAYRTMVAATDYDEAWVEATMVRKVWGYAAERTPSTHPVAGAPAPDGDTALQNFDGISYAKGASVLRQLIAHIGDDAFIAGVHDYLSTHAYGNGRLVDFLTALERSCGRSLASWSAQWLETAGVDRIAVDLGAAAITRQPPPDHPADRPHTFDVAGFGDGRELWREPVSIDVPERVVPGIGPAAVVVPNAADLTWATVELDADTVTSLPQTLAQVPDRQARAVIWVALIDGVALGTIDPRHVLSIFERAWPQEDEPAIASRVGTFIQDRLVSEFLPTPEQAAATATVAQAAQRALDRAGDGPTALAAARLLARTSADVEALLRWAGGDGTPLGLAGDDDFRWVVLTRLAELDAVDDDFLLAQGAQDATLAGGWSLLTARAARPTTTAKAWAWAELTGNRARSNYDLNALATGVWRPAPSALVESYARRYFDDVPAMAEWVGEDALARVAEMAYPRTVIEPWLVELNDQALARRGLSAAVRRVIVDADSRIRERLRSRDRFPGS
ncbi:MAG: aminopeptidase N [Nostocoides sp.]